MREGANTSIELPERAKSRIGSSCSQINVFSIVKPKPEAAEAGGRFHPVIQTRDSSPLRISSITRYCVWFSDKVRWISAGGPSPLSGKLASNSCRTPAKAVSASEEILL